MRNDNDFFARILKAKPEELPALKKSIETYYGQPKLVAGASAVTGSTLTRVRRQEKLEVIAKKEFSLDYELTGANVPSDEVE